LLKRPFQKNVKFFLGPLIDRKMKCFSHDNLQTIVRNSLFINLSKKFFSLLIISIFVSLWSLNPVWKSSVFWMEKLLRLSAIFITIKDVKILSTTYPTHFGNLIRIVLCGMKRILVAASTFILIFNLAYAQSRYQDSVALKTLYTATKGSAWVNNTEWSTGSVNKWFGVTLKNNLAWNIRLPGNNLIGPIGSSALPGHALGKVDLRNNKINALPNNITADSLFVSGNQLTLTHLLPYASMGNRFQYANQDSVDVPRTVFGRQRDEITLSTTIDAGIAGIVYAWYKNGQRISGADSAELKLTCLTAASAGKYLCALSHPNLPSVTLFTRTIILQIIPDAPQPGPNDNTCLSTYTMRGSLPVLGTGKWSAVNGKGNIVDVNNPNSGATDLRNGANIFRWTVTHGACPSEFMDVVITKDTVGELPFAGVDAVICDTFYQMDATPLTYGKGSWKLVQGDVLLGQKTNPKTKALYVAPGINILRWEANNGACASFFDEMKIVRDLPLQQTNAGKDTALCGTALFLHAEKEINVTGQWSLLSGGGIAVEPTFQQSYIYNLSEGDNVWLWTADNVCLEPITDTVHVWVHYFLKVDAGLDTTMFYTPSNPLLLAKSDLATGGTGAYQYNWSPANYLLQPYQSSGDFMPPEPGTYPFMVVVVDDKGCSDSATRTIEVVQVIHIDVPTLFTPNADGVNDIMILPGIESYPNCEWIVMDRFGKLVYSEKGYQNEWNGVANTGHLAGKALPSDTYFYMLDLGVGKDRVQTGFFVLKKQLND
jgi:gliding motility-associated-like protein